MNMKGFICFLLGLYGVSAPAQQQQVHDATFRFFEAFNKHDTAAISKLCTQDILLRTVRVRNEDTVHVSSSKGQLVAFIASEKANYREEINNPQVITDGFVGTAYVPYRFFLNNSLMHCGVNVLSWINTKEGWKVSHITDSRYNCLEADGNREDTERVAVDNQMTRWHMAAASADFDGYFDAMHNDFVYLGTDSSERWTKQEFAAFCKPYFEKGMGWDFKAIKRHIMFAGNMKLAYLDEVLDTWMGPCRGSAVLQKEGDSWCLLHYNLAVLVPNEKMELFRKKIWQLKKRK